MEVKRLVAWMSVIGFFALSSLVIWVTCAGGGSRYIARRQHIEERAIARLLIGALQAAAKNGDIDLPKDEFVEVDARLLERLKGNNTTGTVYNRDAIMLEYVTRFKILAKDRKADTMLVMERIYSSGKRSQEVSPSLGGEGK